MIRVCHLTTVHHRFDTRIFVKECRSLAAEGFEVYLLVADGNGDEVRDSVHIFDIGLPASRFNRVLSYRRIILQRALEFQADLYHFHDPELLGVGKALARKGKKVIYDAHEDVPRQLLTKPYLPGFVRRPVSRIFELYEDKVVSRLSGIVAATPLIRDRFKRCNEKAIEVQNFPLINEFKTPDIGDVEDKVDAVCYVGAISKVRGIHKIIRAFGYIENAKLLLGGRWETENLRQECIPIKGWDKVEELGFLDRSQVTSTMKKSVAGLVVLEPTINYLDSIPVKMFEYMAAGIPVIASDFPYWRQLLSGVDCAEFVDPENPEEIARAIKKFIGNKDLAASMGRTGREAVMEVFRWEHEKKKLLQLYSEVLQGSS